MRIIQLRTIATIFTAYCAFTCITNLYSMDNFLHEAKKDVGAFAEIFSPALGRFIDGTEQSAIANNKYKDQTAFVTNNTGISTGESLFLDKRLPIIKAALEKKLNRPLEEKQVPKIAFIYSGGGYRAMLYTTAILSRAHQAGLLDTATYITALSGSTWAVAPWISTGMPITKFKDYIQECATKPFTHVTHEEKFLITDAIAVKKTYDQPRTLVDLYGDLLGNRLLAVLGDARQMIYLSDQSEKIGMGEYPYPIYTAIDGRQEIVINQTWYAFTPDTIGDHEYQIPSWGHGLKYKHGASTNNAPEKSLAYNMGTWGSAFAANIEEILDEISSEKTQQEDSGHHEKIIEVLKGKRILPFYAKVPNYLYKTDTADKTLSTEKHMEFVDAGLNTNLPFAPVSGKFPGRMAEILIFFDISAGKIGEELAKVAEYAHRNNLPFPAIDFTDIDKKTISIFKGEHNTVIYMPRISDQQLWAENKHKPEFQDYKLDNFDLSLVTNHGFAATQHFQYSLPHSTILMNQAEFNLHVNEGKIWETIEWHINKK